MGELCSEKKKKSERLRVMHIEIRALYDQLSALEKPVETRLLAKTNYMFGYTF